MEKVQKSMNDLERKITKSNKIVSKGEKMSLGDAIKLGRKSNSIVSTIKKSIKEYDVRSTRPGTKRKTWSKISRTQNSLPKGAGRKPNRRRI
jgi:hypothetical protein